MPLVQSDSRSAFERNFKAELASKPRDQALAIAYSVQRRNKHAIGGGIGSIPSSAGIGSARIPDIPFHAGGLIESSVAGRTDRLPIQVRSDSHVWPADVVSAAGQGNTAAGARNIEAALQMRPTWRWGSKQGMAVGGKAQMTPILAAGGELITDPDDVLDLGERAIVVGLGNEGESAIDVGHRLIDQAIERIRKWQIEWLKTAPSPKK